MGSDEDPKDGKSVAAAVFGAVIIYGVRPTNTSFASEIFQKREYMSHEPALINITGLPSLLRQSGFPSPETASGRRDRAAVRYELKDREKDKYDAKGRLLVQASRLPTLRARLFELLVI